MLAYFPRPYPDELLYSVLARFHRHTLGQGMKSTLGELFGRQTVSAVVDLPTGLRELHARTYPCLPLSPEVIAWDLTLLPYYVAYVPAARGDRVLRSMLGCNGGDIHTRSGIAASTVNVPSHLRTCRECASEDVARYGETYWRRLFQVPGVYACPIHGIALTESSARYRPTTKHDLVAADSGSLAKSPAVDLSGRSLRIAVEIAAMARELLDRPRISGAMQVKKADYVNEVMGAGYAKRSRVDQVRLGRDFCAHFDDALLGTMGCGVRGSRDTSWLANMFRRCYDRGHPLQHLLVRHFLASAGSAGATFGAGPWRCLNPLAGHYREARIASVRLSRAKQTGELVGTFLCDCGYAYAARLPREQGCDPIPTVVVAHGPVYAQRASELLAKGMTVRAVAKTLNISWKTAKKLAAGEARVLRSGDTPRSSRPSERLAASSLKGAGAPAPRVDWASRDRSLADLVRTTALSMNSVTPPRWITASAIAGCIDRKSMLANKLSLLPATRQALSEVCETRGQWQCRRLAWAAAELRLTRLTPFRTNLTRAARLNDARLTSEARYCLAQLAQT